MSTILDALRKLQRERAASNPSRDLRGSVTDEIPMPQPRRSSPRRGLALGVLAASLAILAGVGGTWLYKRGVLTRAPAAPAQVAAVPEEPQDEIPSDAELDELERETAAREAASEAPPPVAASPNPPPEVPATNADEAAAERARLEEARRAAAAADEARQQAEAKAAADAAADAATAATPDEPATAAMLAPPPAPAAAPVVAPTPKPVAKPKPAPKAKPAPPPPEPARREPPPDSNPDAGTDALAPTAFPEVRVESIRWHPVAERRAASLHFAQQNVADAHEGDIIGGVLVFRIEPGAVELRVGSTSRVVRPGP